jgi:hypothetical protein
MMNWNNGQSVMANGNGMSTRKHPDECPGVFELMELFDIG